MQKVLFLVVLVVLLYPAKVTSQTPDYLIIPDIALVEVVRVVPKVPRLDEKGENSRGLKYWDTSQLNYGVGYLEGFNNRIVIAGHNPGAFARLGELKMGSEIWLNQGGDILVFEVRNNQVVGIYDFWALRDTDHPVLTLITCWNGGQERLLVNAAKRN